MISKRLLTAGYLWNLKFDCQASFEEYLWGLEVKCLRYKILDECICSDGTVIVLILQQYKSVPLVDL